MKFPPPRTSGEQFDDYDYPVADERPGFVFPPPRRLDPSTPFEVAEQIAGEFNTVTETVANYGSVLEDYGNALERKVEPWAVPTVAPLSSTINRRADPTFQLSDFMVPNLPLAGTTNGASGHFHDLTSPSIGDPGRVERGLAGGWSEKSYAYFAFITPAINRAYEELNFMVGPVTSPCNMDVSVYVVDESRQLNRQVGPVRVSDSIGLGQSLVTIPFERWVATQGSYVAVMFYQSGTGNTRDLLGLNDTPRPLSNVVFPRRIGARRTTSGAPGTTVDGESSIDFEHANSWFVPYAELSEAVGIDYRVFNDSFNYDGVLGRPWLALTSQGISSDIDYHAVKATGIGTRVSMYDTPMSTDYVRIKTSVARLWGNNQRRSTVIVRGTRDLRSGVGVSVINNSRYEIIRWSSQNPDRNWDEGKTVVATINVTPSVGHNLEIDYLAGELVVRINGLESARVASVGGPAAAAGRFLGFQLERTSGGWFASYPSPWLGVWSAQDLPQAGGDGGGDDGETGEE